MSLRNGLLLVTGVVAVSFAAIFIRYAEAPSLTIAMYRQVLAAGVVLPLALALRPRELRSLTRRQLGLAAGSGAFLALHFATWIPSVKLTTVAASVVLVTASPIFVAAGSRLLFGERVGPITVGGILVGLAGAAVVSGGDSAVSTRALAGDLLALAGAVAAAGYFLVGRRLRQEVSALTYVGVVYATCAVLLWPVAALSGSRLAGFDGKTWTMFVLLALVPQLLGHTIFNFVLREVSATVVTISVMGEPVGSTLLALAFFGEVPPGTAVIGGGLVLGGIYVAVTAQARVTRRAGAAPEAVVTPLE